MTPNEMDALAWLARRIEWEATVEELHARRAKDEALAETTVSVPEARAPRFRRGRTSPVRGMSRRGAIATMQQ